MLPRADVIVGLRRPQVRPVAAAYPAQERGLRRGEAYPSTSTAARSSAKQRARAAGV
jgi:hypothetical protein